jgi:hypothetical protein
VKAIKHMLVTAKAPSAEGTFDGAIIYNPPEGDSDNERIENFTNTPGTFPLDFQHLATLDPGSIIGTIKANEVGDGKTLAVSGKLGLGEKMADAVHERMLLPDDDPMVLKELSVAYSYDPSKNTKDPNGVVVNHDAELLAISVVHAGSQATMVKNVKSELDVLSAEAQVGLISPATALKYAADLGVPGDIMESLMKSMATFEGEKTAVTDDLDPEIATVIETVRAEADEAELAFEKALSGKPWHISEQDGKFCIIKDSDNSTVNCHDTRADALAQMRALYANEGKAADEAAAEEKAGRVIGAKRVSDLKTRMAEVLDAWAGEVNGDLAAGKAEEAEQDAEAAAKAAEEASTEEAEKAATEADELKELTARLDALLLDQ